LSGLKAKRPPSEILEDVKYKVESFPVTIPVCNSGVFTNLSQIPILDLYIYFFQLIADHDGSLARDY